MDEVLNERKGAGAWLCLDRPEQLNAFNPATMSQLPYHIDRARVDNEVRALVITGGDSPHPSGVARLRRACGGAARWPGRR